MGKAIKGHEGAAIPWCWMSPTSRAARDQHHGLPQDINTCPSHGKPLVLLPGWGWPRQLWMATDPFTQPWAPVRAPKGLSTLRVPSWNPLTRVQHPRVHPCHAWCHLHGLGAGGTGLTLQELCSANCSN